MSMDHPGTTVRLEPMSDEAWDAWRVVSVREYAAEKVRAGAWQSDGADQRAATAFATLLPDGRRTAGHEFRSIIDKAGEAIGAIWFAADAEMGRGSLFIWDIVIDEGRRGQGYGRAAMEALEPLARSLGYDTIRLHVFGHNEVARSLYSAVGYTETDVQMAKRIG